MRNVYQYELAKARLKPKVRELVFQRMLENPKAHELAEVISLMDTMLAQEINAHKLAPIPEHNSMMIDYKI